MKTLLFTASAAALFGGLGFVAGQRRGRQTARAPDILVRKERPSHPAPYTPHEPQAPAGAVGMTLAQLRELHGVTMPPGSVRGDTIAQLGRGRYAYAPLGGLVALNSETVITAGSGGGVEVHRDTAGNLHLVGYVDAATANALRQPNPAPCVWVGQPTGGRTQVASIPFTRIQRAEVRSDRGLRVLVTYVA
ncbi:MULTISPECIES: hypothetical protein [unclassified Corallococcus]|uniref:hypothetical protein n=1 Tax=unclassified Corallococcus TaxID=2685029 RepID=UPI001A8E5014|nr:MULTISPECIES: hypothetical protein [unclassified Corallococcus]MBN9685399.1 hypothetical protein [Corallococcus sp. NCSPR001]WAS83150.1 hypothetical protein O0N60_27995 [Corallococcus sp. NCRR]